MTVDVATYRRSVIALSRLIVTVPLCEEPNTSTVCECGGLLAYVTGRWQHVEACVDCHDSDQPCRDSHRHIACVDPLPKTCAHGNCREEVSMVIECARGLANRTCCGCCWDMSDALEARRMWPR